MDDTEHRFTLPNLLTHFTPGGDSVYMLTAAPGLEALAADEAVCKLSADIYAVIRGKVFFTEAGRTHSVLPAHAAGCAYTALRLADNIYEFILSSPTQNIRAALVKYPSLIGAAPFKEMLGRFHGNAYTVNASITGKHNYSRFEAAAAFGAALETVYDMKPGNANERGTEFRLDIINEHLLIFVKLTDAAFRYRGKERISQQGALRPTVAHALVWAAGVYAEEVFMDPFCGSGTILCERAYYPHKALYGCDINETAAACAKENLRMSGGNANIIASDFRKLDLPNAYVDTIVTNPPWGAQIKVDDLNALYKDFLRCAQAWLKPGGRMVILVPPIDAITRALDTNVFSCQKIYTVSLHGTLAQVLNLQLR